MKKEQFKQKRKELGHTQEELAPLIKCSLSSVRAYEQGTRKPHSNTIDKLNELILRKRLDNTNT